VLAEVASSTSGRLCAVLAAAAGPAGMIAGQVADMDLCALPAGADGLFYIHTRKTAALIRGAARMGAVAAGAHPEIWELVDHYAQAIGVVFQIVDDILDVVGQAATLGKTPGKDARAGKKTYPAAIGLDGARKLSRDLTARALEALAPLGERAAGLRTLGELLVERTY